MAIVSRDLCRKQRKTRLATEVPASLLLYSGSVSPPLIAAD